MLNMFKKTFKFKLILILPALIFCSSLFAASCHDDDDNYEDTEHFLYKGIECCCCYKHCLCFGLSIGNESYCFPKDKPEHLKDKANLVWHEFMKGILRAKLEAQFSYTEKELKYLIYDVYGKWGDEEREVHFLSEYLDIIQKLKEKFNNDRVRSIKFYNDLYNSGKEKDKKDKHVKEAEERYKNGCQVLEQLPSQIISLYKDMISKCPHKSFLTIYNRGLLRSMEGDWEGALNDIRLVIDSNKLKNDIVSSKICQKLGEACIELNLFIEAIDSLDKAINKAPENKEAYFFRAAAYFEIGNFEEALNDYLMSDKGKSFAKTIKAPKGFKQSLLENLCIGMQEGSVEFCPSLCNSIFGLSTCIWAAHPLNPQVLDNAKEFSEVCYEAAKIIINTSKNIDWEQIDQSIAESLKNLDNLNNEKKGEVIGHTIGKYGVEIIGQAIMCLGAAKGIELSTSTYTTLQKIKNLNRACNLESMALSNANKESMIASACQHSVKRESFFKNSKIIKDLQSKHMKGAHNFEPMKSEWVHPDPQGLLTKFSGTGMPIKNEHYSVPGYKERVDFEEIIGYYTTKKDPNLKLPTTKGIIHYSKKGAHIVPSHPEGY
ncbi:MAG: hypothetical protein H0V82_12795 [Candidatus Protochlamydia sp.]|nr:hypothetical protein [Candidatus Protochlamydia sp.]